RDDLHDRFSLDVVQLTHRVVHEPSMRAISPIAVEGGRARGRPEAVAILGTAREREEKRRGVRSSSTGGSDSQQLALCLVGDDVECAVRTFANVPNASASIGE